MLASAIEVLAAAPAGDAEALLGLERLADRLDAERARRVRAVHANGTWSGDGAPTMVAWLRAGLRCSHARASRAVRHAGTLGALPATEDAWARGRITTDHALLLAGCARDAAAPLEFAEFEPHALRVAQAGPPDDLRRALLRWRHLLDDHRQQAGASLAVRQYEQRHVHLIDGWDGAGFITGTLPPDEMMLVRRAVDLEFDRQHQAGDARSGPQQRADALVGIARHYLGCQGVPAGSPREPHVMVVIDPVTYARFSDAPRSAHERPGEHGHEVAGRCHTLDGQPVSVHAAARAACTGTLQALLVGLDGAPLALGPSVRVFSRAQRRAITIRDGGCRYPDCHRPARDCQVHHVRPHSHGGPTDVSNGLLLCWHHHHRLHEHRESVTLHADGTATFHPSPDRHQVVRTTAPHPPPGVARARPRAGP